MSWGINPNATEKEKIFADFNDALNGMNSVGDLSYSHYSEIFDLGRELADKEYAQGRADKYQEIVSEYMLLTEKQVAEIRTETIDECKALFRKYILTKEIDGLNDLFEQLK